MPTRYLKPGIRDSAAIDALSPMAECLFYRLLVTVDDYGRYDARPALIKAQCFPVKESVTVKKIEELLTELATAVLLYLYTVDGKPYLQLAKWDNKARATDSKFPPMQAESAQPPADAYKRMQVRTDVNDPPTNLPVTGTVTVTKTETGTRASAAPDGVSDSVWKDFRALRDNQRAPLTATAIEGIRREATKAGVTLEHALRECCARGWRGFKADWIDKPPPEPKGRDPTLVKLEEDAKKAVPPPPDVAAKLAGLVEHMRVQ